MTAVRDVSRDPATKKVEQPPSGPRGRRAALAIATLLVAAGTALRLDGITGPLLQQSSALTIRQYHSAVLARGYFLERDDSAPAWQRRVALVNRREETLVEPPLLEYAAALLYDAGGEERVWIPRVLSSLFWVLGGVALYRLARRLTTSAGALVSLAVYLFLPFGVIASRGFQPDPLMVALILASALAIVRWHEQPSARRFLAAASVAALAALVKPGIALIFLLPFFLALLAVRSGAMGALRARSSWGFFSLAALPSLGYYVYGRLFDDYLTGQASDKLRPDLLAERSFWLGWSSRAVDVLHVLGRAPRITAALVVAGALIGLVLARRGTPRAIILGLGAGYVMFSLLFTQHISTHDYYSLGLVPVVALAIAPLAGAAVRVVELVGHGALVAAAVTAAAVLAFGAWRIHGELVDDQYASEIALYETVGARVDHTPSALLLSAHYALPIKYHGWIGGRYWPEHDERGSVTVADLFQAEERWPAVRSMRPAPTHFVATDLDELAEQRDLLAYLRARHRVERETSRYVIFSFER